MCSHLIVWAALNLGVIKVGCHARGIVDEPRPNKINWNKLSENSSSNRAASALLRENEWKKYNQGLFVVL